MKRKTQVSEEIDKLTNSIENAITGDVFETTFHRLHVPDSKYVKTKDWVFDWGEEIGTGNREIYKLTIKDNPDIIQGLISLEVRTGHVFIHLVESARFNKGDGKAYLGVLGNLFAFACKRSYDEGLNGFVGFFAKTKLIEHFKRELGAIQFKGQRMYIENTQAVKLIEQYFKS